MKAYGYEVEGSAAALADVAEVVEIPGCGINWKLFNTGDLYWTGNGERCKVTINHEVKRVALNEW